MRFILASISLGGFAWASYMVLTGRVPGSDADAQPLMLMVQQSTEAIGVNQTALALLAVGAAIAFGIIAFGPREDDV
ncbi:MAG: hypothetical protein AAF566_00040 [Pseudomonadota bacterium]